VTLVTREGNDISTLYPSLRDDFIAFAEKRFGRGVVDVKRAEYILNKPF